MASTQEPLKPLAWVMPGSLHENTHYIIRGKNSDSYKHQQVIVCVHGIGSYHGTYDLLADDLVKSGYIVVLYDLIGRGFSLPSSSGTYGEEDHIQQLHSLLEAIRDQVPSAPYHFVCHSMGGAIGTIFASRYPHFVKSLTLLSPAGLMGYMPVGLLHSIGFLQSLVRPIICADYMQRQAWKTDFFLHTGESLVMENQRIENLALVVANNPTSRDAFWKSVLQFPLRNIDDHVKNIAKRENFPILLLWAKEDTAVPMDPNYSNWLNYLQKKESEMESATTTCSLETKVYEKACHGFFIEYWSVVNQDILQFLAKH
jgi:pimeloyl-ACP methyl ester carboxylesterase